MTIERERLSELFSSSMLGVQEETKTNGSHREMENRIG